MKSLVKKNHPSMIQFPKENNCCVRITREHFGGKLTWNFIRRARQRKITKISNHIMKII